MCRNKNDFLFFGKNAVLAASVFLAFVVACSNSIESDMDEVSSSSLCEDCDDEESSSSNGKSSPSSSDIGSSNSSGQDLSSEESDSSSSSSDMSSSSRMGLPPCRTADGSTDNCEYGEFTDERDGQTYKTVKIGSQTWMAENLRYVRNSSCNLYSIEQCCYDDDSPKCVERFYRELSVVCPPGWHVPSEAEFDTLVNAVGGPSEAGYSLKSASGWIGNNGMDGYGFNAKAVGVDHGSDPDTRYGTGTKTCFWMDKGRCFELDCKSDATHKTHFAGVSIRCLLGDSTQFLPRVSPCRIGGSDNCEYGTLTDARDNQTYKTVKIGEQTWMAQNLNYKTDSSFCYKDEESYCAKFGRLYLWKDGAEKDACPDGWHVPSKAEFDTLVAVVGGSALAGLSLKASTDWVEDGFPLSEGTGYDSYGFAALPAGSRIFTGSYSTPENTIADFWSSTKDSTRNSYSSSGEEAYILRLKSETDAVNQYSYSLASDIDNAYSIRCLKD